MGASDVFVLLCPTLRFQVLTVDDVCRPENAYGVISNLKNEEIRRKIFGLSGKGDVNPGARIRYGFKSKHNEASHVA